MHTLFNKTILATLLLSSHVYAQDVKITGSTTLSVKTPTTAATMTPGGNPRQITLLKVQVSEQAKLLIAKQAEKTLKQDDANTLKSNSRLPHKVQLGMNDVPVLNQGNHGTCVTFAVTAALDAAIGEGDYISQLCSLELGTNFETNGYAPSGWDGTWARGLLGQISTFGVINKEQQLQRGCGGLTDYPVSSPAIGSGMTLEDFHQMSESLEDRQVEWTPILDVNDSTTSRIDTNETLNQVKKSLNNGYRVTFGTLLLDFDLGFVGAVGTHNATFDSWVLTPEIARDIYLKNDFGAHEMVITGYDDKAVAYDEHKQPHKGLLTLRNSWSDTVGDHGNFYMSYDYFKVLVLEAYSIKTMG